MKIKNLWFLLVLISTTIWGQNEIKFATTNHAELDQKLSTSHIIESSWFQQLNSNYLRKILN